MILIAIGLIYLSGALLSYGVMKGTILRTFPTTSWKRSDNFICACLGLFSWFMFFVILILSKLQGDKIGFALRVPKAMR